MYEPLGHLELKSGERVEVGVVNGPDLDWAGRIEDLLSHKGVDWSWQIRQALREDLGVDPYFYVLHRDGVPFAQMMSVEQKGVGVFGHVWTVPADRRQGASSGLMDRMMDHFGTRGGQALFLGTRFGSPAYHIYRSHGFEGIAPRSGTMTFYAASRENFEAAYFAAGSVRVTELDWPSWPPSSALFLGDFPGEIRCAPLRRFGRANPEAALLPVIREARESRTQRKPPRAVALVQTDTTAVAGLSMWGQHPLWPRTCLVDVYCHPSFWAHAGGLLDALSLPEADRYLAYSDPTCPQKADALAGAGFRATVIYERRIDSRETMLDVTVWERS